MLFDFLGEVANVVGSLRVEKRRFERYPFDYLAEAFMAKALSLGRSIAILLESDQSDEALGLCRSLVECSYILRYITADPDAQSERTKKYIEFAISEKSLWLHWTLKRAQTEEQREEHRAFALKRGYLDDSKSGFKHWSGEDRFIERTSRMKHPLDPPELPVDHSWMQRAVEYFWPSAFVHCSAPGLASKFPEDGKVTLHSASSNDPLTAERAAIMVQFHVMHVTMYGLYGMRVDQPQGLIDLRIEVDARINGA